MANIASTDATGLLPAASGALDRRRLRLILVIAGPLLVALAGLYFYLTGGRFVTTENAYVGAETVRVTSEVAGKIVAVPVKEGQAVKAGDILFQIDPAPYRIALERADAQMNAVALALASLKQQYAQTLADAQAARADAALAAKQLDRVSALADRQFASRADFDKAQSALTAAQAKVASLDQAAQAKLAELAGDADLPLERFPQYLEAKAARDDAQRNLDQSTVRATIDGVVSQTDQLVPGYYVNIGTVAAVVVSATNIWLDANLVETDLTHVVPGDAATVKVDTYPDTEFRGRVIAVAPATGAEFSVIPAQNASGNWVKVVQRVTVRVAIERRPGDPALRAGLSAYVAIDTGHSRSLADLF